MLNSLRQKLAAALLGVSSGRLNFLYTGKTIQVLPGEIRTYLTAYTENEVIHAVQDWKSAKVAAPPPVLYQVTDRKAFKAYRAARQKWAENRYDYRLKGQVDGLRAKALKEVEQHDLLRVLERPNPMQTRTELMAQIDTMRDVCGSTFLYGNTGLKEKGPIKELWRLPELGMQVEGMGLMEPPRQYRALGITEPIPAHKVLMLKRFNPLEEINMHWHVGLSKLEPLREGVIQKMKAAAEAETEILQNRGQRDLVFPEKADMVETNGEQMKAAQDSLDAKLKTKKRVIATGVPLKTIKIGNSPVDLGFENVDDRMWTQVCALYHVSKLIFSVTKDASYNNILEARKYSLIDGVLPDQAILYDYLNRFFVASYEEGGQSLYLEPDLDFYPELQADLKKKAEYLSMLPLKPNEMREAFGYEPITEHEFMEVPMIPQGRQPVTDFEAIKTDDPDKDAYDDDEEDPKDEDTDE